ncbi:MAG: GlcG/HbpS family heme-binding protein [Candidatus Rokuibacteriota bacterium]
MKQSLTCLFIAAVVIGVIGWAEAQPAYGPSITLEQAKKVMAGAEAEAKKNNWPVVIAILDSGGNIVLLQRLDDTQFGSIEVARQKAWSAVAYRRPSKVWQDVVAGGGAGLRILKLEGAAPFDGGLPILVDGRIVGAVGVSGVTGEQDGQIAKAGVDALK